MKNLLLLTITCLALGCSSGDESTANSDNEQAQAANSGQPRKGGVSFHYRFNKGDILTESRSTTQNITGADGQKFLINADVELSWEVLDTINDRYRIHIIGKKYHIRVRDGAGSVDEEYDSEEGGNLDNPFIASLLKPRMDAYRKTDMIVTMKKSGRITGIEATDEFKQALASDPILQASVPITPDGQHGLGHAFFELPEGDVVPGDEWENVYEWKPNPDVDRILKFVNSVRYVGIEEIDGRDLHRFEIDVSLRLPQNSVPGSETAAPLMTFKRLALVDREAEKLFRAELIEEAPLQGSMIKAKHITSIE